MSPQNVATRKLVLFVGAFADAIPGGTVGGQIYACRSVIDSSLSKHVDWRLIDSSMKSIPPPPMLARGGLAAQRCYQVFTELRKNVPDAALIFTSYAWTGLLEKAFMTRLCRLFNVPVVISIRSEVRRLPLNRLLLLVLRRIILDCRAIWCQSLATKESLNKVLPAQSAKFTVIPNWIDTAKYPPKADYNYALGKPLRLLFMSRVSRDKGIFEFR